MYQIFTLEDGKQISELVWCVGLVAAKVLMICATLMKNATVELLKSTDCTE